jgi:hypothetical protein
VKTLHIATTFFILLASSCNDFTATEPPSVENYIQQLKSNQFQADHLPLFTDQDIPALLAYRDDKQLITNFPRTTPSSYYQRECTVGMFVLWTVESIRAVAINSDRLIGRFPSQNPILAIRNSNQLTLVADDRSHSIAANAYYDWWLNIPSNGFAIMKTVDPLAKTDYRWH